MKKKQKAKQVKKVKKSSKPVKAVKKKLVPRKAKPAAKTSKHAKKPVKPAKKPAKAVKKPAKVKHVPKPVKKTARKVSVKVTRSSQAAKAAKKKVSAPSKPAAKPKEIIKKTPAPPPAKAPVAAVPTPPTVVSVPKPSLPRPGSKPLPREFLFQLAAAIKDSVAPMVRALRGREIVSSAPTGDATFELDKTAEKALLNFLKGARAPVAYYSEDAGYSTFSNIQPKNLLIVDPIDGTRAAKCGFESCVVSIASTRVIERPTIADIDNACVAEIVGDRVFYAERGKGARIYVQDQIKRPKLSTTTNLETISWSMTVPARPAELVFPTAARLIDLNSLKGGFFACNSTSYSLTRLITGQLDACVDVAARFMRDIPEIVRDHFVNAGRGSVLGIAPYDFAAAILITQEAGCKVTDAYGNNFDQVLLLDSSSGNHQSLIAAANAELHAKLMNFFDTRMRQFEALLKRRAEASH
ncbi:MAG TPA: inositol monophosphatase family protein [Candidatus Hydrogenedentes bacterium]|nr:inositol monophosphatase family protein [Candidatus Hydrogenedentota bacterium]